MDRWDAVRKRTAARQHLAHQWRLCGFKLKQIGAWLGVSRERARQLAWNGERNARFLRLKVLRGGANPRLGVATWTPEMQAIEQPYLDNPPPT